MNKKDTLIKLFKENGLDKEDVFKSPQGFAIITRSGIEKIQAKNNITVRFISEKLEPSFVVIKAIGTKGDAMIETYGESSPDNTRQKYPVAMAEKRALARCILKISGMYEHGVFGEDEADDFKKDKKPFDGMD